MQLNNNQIWSSINLITVANEQIKYLVK